MDRYTFLKSLSEAGVAAIQWDADEFASEFAESGYLQS
jgi:hypothetical protein